MDTRFLKGGAGCLLGGLSQLALSGLGIAIHIGTIIIAYKVSGVISAIVSAGFPFFAQIYWVYKVWSISGVLLNFYTIAILVYLGLVVTFFVGCALASSADS